MIFPNPARDKLTIRNNREFSEIEVFDSYGKQIFKTIIESKEKSIDISNLRNGIYFINFINLTNQNRYEKFIKY